jgi:hypothetical protein
MVCAGSGPGSVVLNNRDIEEKQKAGSIAARQSSSDDA